MSKKLSYAIIAAIALFLAYVVYIRLFYGIDAPFEDFMPDILAKLAYMVNRCIPQFTYFEDGSFVIGGKWLKIVGCNPFGICN